ncbi:MAG: type II toxin-antitoxin system HipA family toxin, partial [Desulfobacterales bacterium]|nr:type II toxin-antitoxin system HipA family toxin [Desulfobacterales bacterium]
KLPLQPEIFEHKDRDFSPVFGLFDDSLPDGWGLLLMDRFLRGRGYDIDALSILDRLAFFGANTMGALIYEPEMDLKRSDNTPFDVHNLSIQSNDILTGNTDEVLPQLINAGGSPGGARPKVLVGIFNEKMISGEADLPEHFEHWIIKFPAGNDFPDAGPLEYAYSLMARDAGIKMSETRLFSTPEGDRFFGIKRFDRKGNKRFHVHTFGNLIHSNFRIPSQDYDQFFRAVINLTKNHQDLTRAFRQMVFNIFTNNRDDHVKNFAFIMDHEGEWSLSPAYDLIYSPGPGGQHSMTVSGEGKAPAKSDIYKLGEKHGIGKQVIGGIVEQVSAAANRFIRHAQSAGVSKSTRNKILAGIKRNI